MKAPKQTFYAYICPVCKWKTVGNWKDKQLQEYLFHYSQAHFPDPIIKSERR